MRKVPDQPSSAQSNERAAMNFLSRRVLLTGSLVLLASLFHVFTASAVCTQFQFQLKWGVSGIATGQFNGPLGVARASDGTIYVADRYNHRIQRFNPQG